VRESKEARVKYVFACEVRDSRVWRGSSVFRVCVCWYDTDGACVVMPQRERGYSNTCSAC
jgi:hypothetical protein